MWVIKSKDLEQIISKHKTLAAKKFELTKVLKDLKIYYKDIKKAYTSKPRNESHGWYLGHKIGTKDLKAAEDNIKFVEQFKNNL